MGSGDGCWSRRLITPGRVRRLMRRSPSPAGDQMKDRESGRASLEDGFTSLATLLHNAMILAPFTATELRVVLYVARKTYGHARKHARGSRAIIDNQEMAQLVGCSQKSICNVVCNLVNIRVLNVGDATRGGHRPSRTIGINTNTLQWGDDGDAWSKFRVDVIETWDVFNRGSGAGNRPSGKDGQSPTVPQGRTVRAPTVPQGRTVRAPTVPQRRTVRAPTVPQGGTVRAQPSLREGRLG